jgi:hypothetical protein
MDDFPLGLRRLDMFGARAVASFTSNIEFGILGFVTMVNLS